MGHAGHGSTDLWVMWVMRHKMWPIVSSDVYLKYCTSLTKLYDGKNQGRLRPRSWPKRFVTRLLARDLCATATIFLSGKLRRQLGCRVFGLCLYNVYSVWTNTCSRCEQLCFSCRWLHRCVDGQQTDHTHITQASECTLDIIITSAMEGCIASVCLSVCQQDNSKVVNELWWIIGRARCVISKKTD